MGKESIRQQKGEGWFPTFSDVSEKAISMSVMKPNKNVWLYLDKDQASVL